MFNEKHMENRDRPLESIEDALLVIAAHRNCSGTSCAECAITMYGHGCGAYIIKAYKVLYESLGIDLDTEAAEGSGKLEAQENIYKQIFDDKKMKRAVSALEAGSGRSGGGTCETCQHSRMTEGGILFCKSFFNFTHKDGFCYRHKPVKMEVEETIDLPKKSPDPTPKQEEDQEVEIPF